MALPSDNANPFLAVNLPLVLESPPGTNSATESLRMGLLAMARLHQLALAEQSPNSSSTAVDEIKDAAFQFRHAASQHLRIATRSSQDNCSDSALAAAVTLSLIDVSAQSFTASCPWPSDFQRADIDSVLRLRSSLVEKTGSQISQLQKELYRCGAVHSPLSHATPQSIRNSVVVVEC